MSVRLTASGIIRMSEINVELGRASDAEISLKNAETGEYGTLNYSFAGNKSAPHKMSEFYSYIHFPLVQEEDIIEFWDSRYATTTNWKSVYGNFTNMSVNGATYDTGTPINFAFDGTDDYIKTDDSITLGDKWTIAVWVRHTEDQSVQNYDRIFGMTSFQFDLAEGVDGKLKFYDGGWNTVDDIEIDEGVWQQITITYNADNRTLIIYSEGDQEYIADEGRAVDAKFIWLGSQYSTGENWEGEIAKFVLWDAELNATRVGQVFDNDKGYWG